MRSRHCSRPAAEPSPIAYARTRHALAILRVAMYFVLGCALLLGAGFLLREQRFSPRQWPTAEHPAPSQSTYLTGITVEPDAYAAGELATALHALDAAGFDWVRVVVDWAQVEPTPGHYDWGEVDAFFQALYATDLVPVIVLTNSPPWARAPHDQDPAFTGSAPPQDPATFARFAADLARRYADSSPALSSTQARYYQIWDEPNIAPNWGTRHIEPVAYAHLTRTAVAAIRQVDSRAQILAGALAPTNDRGHLALDEVYFLQRFLAAGGGEWIDAFAFQPYGFAQPPQPSISMRDRLGFDRLGYVRRALEATGYGHKPIWAVRFGWNRQANPIWRAVTPATQVAFTTQALSLAREWPWLHGMGWAIARPAAPPSDAHWGFALTPELIHTFTQANTGPDIHTGPEMSTSIGLTTNSLTTSGLTTRTATDTTPQHRRVPFWLAGSMLLAAVVFSIQRGYAATQQITTTSRAAYLARPTPILPNIAPRPPLIALCWLLLGTIYYFATWPPLIALCWLLAGIGVWRRPHYGLYLAALSLPFYFQHKDVHLVDLRLSVPPAYIFTLALLLPLIQGLCRNFSNEWPFIAAGRRDGLLWGGSWVLMGLLAGGVTGIASTPLSGFGFDGSSIRHLPAFFQGLWDVVLVPLILFWAVVALKLDRHQGRLLALCLAGGGVLAALLGLGQWWIGQGVLADGTLRLTGPYFSPNHMALYLVRTLFIVWGLAQFYAGRGRVAGWLALLGLAGVLFLTASRGALLLGLPAGLLCLWLGYYRQPRFGGLRATMYLLWQRRKPNSIGLGAIGLGLLIAAGLLIGLGLDISLGTGWGIGYQRFLNAATVVERLQIWHASWQLWRVHLWTGVGPGGFFWTFPAYLQPPVTVDPNLRHPHNLGLEILTTWGIVGALWCGALSYRLFIRIRHQIKQQWEANRRLPPLYVAFLAGLMAGLAHAQVDAFMALADLAAWNGIALGFLWRNGRADHVQKCEENKK